jgi:hydrogenase nickel incorporation protein HypA/HybF
MYNPSIAMREELLIRSIFDKTLRQARSSQTAIVSVRFVLGEIAELDPEQIRLRWQVLSRGTLLEHAKIHFRLIAGEVQCMACFKKYQPVDGRINCPHCGGFGAKILSGEEFYVEKLEMDE